jgi:hypothetical protein
LDVLARKILHSRYSEEEMYGNFPVLGTSSTFKHPVFCARCPFYSIPPLIIYLRYRVRCTCLTYSPETPYSIFLRLLKACLRLEDFLANPIPGELCRACWCSRSLQSTAHFLLKRRSGASSFQLPLTRGEKDSEQLHRCSHLGTFDSPRKLRFVRPCKAEAYVPNIRRCVQLPTNKSERNDG